MFNLLYNPPINIKQIALFVLILVCYITWSPHEFSFFPSFVVITLKPVNF